MLNQLFQSYSFIFEVYHLIYQVLRLVRDVIPMCILQNNIALTSLLNDFFQEAREER